MAPTFSKDDRVTHANPFVSYGAGVIQHIHPAALSSRPPAFAQVHFDGERCSRRVFIADLAPAAEARLVWPPERAGLRVVDAPAVA